MYKVELKNRWYDYDYIISGINQEMYQLRQWCYDNFGNAADTSDPAGLKYNWRGSTSMMKDEDDDIFYKIYPVFFFRDQTHATWFTMRWSNG